MTGSSREHLTEAMRLEKLQKISEDYTAALAMLTDWTMNGATLLRIESKPRSNQARQVASS